MFHVSLLKAAVGLVDASPTLPEDLLAVDPPYLPEMIVAESFSVILILKIDLCYFIA